jgi:hypothetical protein
MREKYSFYLALATGGLIFVITLWFALLQSPETLSVSVRRGMAISHPVEGHHECDSCHGRTGTNPYPVRHLGWSNTSCTRCHQPPAIESVSPAAETRKSAMGIEC